MATLRTNSSRLNTLGNNENAFKSGKEVTKMAATKLRRPALGDRTNIQKSVSDAKNSAAFKKPVDLIKPTLVKKSSFKKSEKENVTKNRNAAELKRVQEPSSDSTMVSVNASVTENDTSAAISRDVSSMSVQDASHLKQTDITEEQIEELAESFSNKLLTVTDIDAEDKDNPQLVSEYVNEIYAYMRSMETKHPVKKRYLEGCAVTPRMRSILVDWLVQVHLRFNLMQETLFLTISILDRYLQMKPNTAKENLQLVGVTAMFIASKYEEIYTPEINDFVFITDKAYTKKQIRLMEVEMLRGLDFYVSFPLPIHFLRRNSKAGQVDGSQHTLAKYLIELCLPEYTMCHYKASEVGAAALCLTLKLIGDEPDWTDTVVYYSAYTESQLDPIICKMAQTVTRSHSSKQQAIPQKYQSSKYMKISELPQLRGNLIRSLSEKAATHSY